MDVYVRKWDVHERTRTNYRLNYRYDVDICVWIAARGRTIVFVYLSV